MFGRWPKGVGAGQAQGGGARLLAWNGLTGYQVGLMQGTVAGGGVQGSTSGFWGAHVVQVLSQAVSSTPRFGFNTFQGGSSKGWDLRTNTTNAAFQGNGYFGGAAIGSPTRTIAAGDVGKLALVVLVYDQPAARLRLYINGVEAGTGTALGAAYSPPVTTPCCLGVRGDGGGLPGTSQRYYGAIGGDGFVPTAAEVLAQFTATRISGVLQSIAGKTTHRWQIPATWNPPVVLTDDVGVQNMTIVTGSAASLSVATDYLAQWM